ncbi:lysylphosphatidylglycerol synthase transmembrane domain-containing protein [Magnetococcus sp. PR-3]|uniref:lysylphosphatidylglycerol synthase transmembrane domain-containing protein n=1 Tax=Magnetococcus sp. PR-3 TaxID=3120355 RepID=UPI002FCE2DE1
MKRIALFILKLAIASAAIIWLIQEDKLDLGAIPALLDAPMTMVMAMVLLLSAFFVAAFRWWLLMRIKQLGVSLLSSVQIVFITNFFTTFMPGGMLTADLVRAGYTFQNAPEKRTEGAVSIFADRFVALFSIFCIGTVVGIFQQENLAQQPILNALWWVCVLSITLLPVTFVVLYRLARRVVYFQRIVNGELKGPIYSIIQRMVQAGRIYRRNMLTLLIVLLLSMVMHTLAVGTFILFSSVVVPGAPLDSLDYLFAAPWAWIATLLPVSPGGLGVGEAAFDQVCRMLDGGSVIFSYASLYLAFRILSAICSLPGVVIYLLYRSRVQSAIDEGGASS